MSKFSLKFKLRQHTPLIHFQHDQSGATLRATEVKSKLDRYIWKKVWHNNFANGARFLTGYSADKSKEFKAKFESANFMALDYRIRFVAYGYKSDTIPEGHRLFFGNLGGESLEKKEKRFVMAEDGISGLVSSFHSELIEILATHLPMFFQVENFGTRQNKGFGSFQITDIDDKPIDFNNPSPYFFQIENNQKTTALWEHIDLLYRTLRSGLNLKGYQQSDKLYFKSLLFQYAKTQNHQWDKRKIRLELFRGHPKFRDVESKRTEPEGTVCYKDGTPMLYRDMLGLSSEQSWLSYGNAKVTKESKDGTIDRFKSPITFKPFRQKNGWLVFIIPQQIPEEMKNAAFVVKSGNRDTSLFTPDFDLEHYLKFAFNYFGPAHTVEDYVGQHLAKNEVQILENIYNQLRKQVNP